MNFSVNPLLRLTFALVAAAGFTTCLWSADWNQFRGPNGSGVASASRLPVEFGPERNVVWKTPLPTGYSSPVLTEDRILLTAAQDDQLLTLSLDRTTGKLLWQNPSPRDRREKLDSRNHPASPSAAVDEDGNVYVFFGDYGLVSYARDGKERWRLPLGPFRNLYGMGASPVIAADKLILVCDQVRDSFLLAVETATGTVAWKVERREARSGHSTPVVWRPPDGDLQVLVAGSFLLDAYSVETGQKIWWVRGLSVEMKSTPVLGEGMIFVNGYATPLNQPDRIVEIEPWETVLAAHDKDGNNRLSAQESPDPRTTSFFSFLDLNEDQSLDATEWNFYRAALASKNGLLGIRLGGSGDMTASNIVWQYHRAVPQLPSPLLFQGLLYMINDGGIATSFRPQDGEVIARGRIRGAVDNYYASPVAGDDKIFLVSESGKVAVLKPDGSLEVVAVNDLQSPCYATPAIADGRIYIRTVDALYAFGLK